MITRVEIKNYKCLADVSVDLTPVHAVIGPNDSGKTSFLEAVAALVNRVTAPKENLPPGWDGQELVWSGASEPVATFAGTMSASNGGVFNLTQTLEFPDHGQSATRRESLTSNTADSSQILKELAPAMLFRFVPEELARPAGPYPDQPYRIDPSGHGLSMLLDDILGYDRVKFAALESEFCEMFPRYSQIRLRRCRGSYRSLSSDGLVKYIDTPGKMILLVDSRSGVEIRAAQSSDGTLIVLAVLTLKHLPEPRSVILVEEPENSIHPQRLQDVVRIMREIATNGPQVIMASHSPYLLDYLEPEEVTVFTRGEDGAAHCLRMSDSEKVKREIKHFNLGEIWTADWEEKLLAKAQEGAGA